MLDEKIESPQYTIEIDTGGTFTDGYVTADGQVIVAKADTTPFDLSVGVLECLNHAAQQLGLSRAEMLRDTAILRLSTTVGTNTLINRDGPTIGLIVDPDNSEIVDELAEGLPFDRELAVVLEDVEELDVDNVQTRVRNLLERGARVLVIALSGGDSLVEREQHVRSLIAESYPRHYLGAVPVLPSHQITPLADDRLRIQSAVLSAYLHPVMSRFLYRVEDALRADGFSRPLLIANANGGVSRVAKTSALRTWGSGPAGGVTATATMSKELNVPVAVGYDVGGTSTDITVILDGNSTYEVQPSIEGIEVAMPALALISAAVGGGSIARVVDGVLRLGPDSAGSQPGPACFGMGGTMPTVTDAACHLGLFDANNFLGGRKTLDPEAATTALEPLARELSKDIDEVANEILGLAGQIIADAISVELQQRGLAMEDAVIFATGGAGGILAAEVHRASGVKESMSFPVSSVFSAFGLSRLPVTHTYDVATDSTDLEEELDAVVERAKMDMQAEGFPVEKIQLTAEAEVVTEDGTVEVKSYPSVDVSQFDSDARLIRVRTLSESVQASLPRAGSQQVTPDTHRHIRWPGDRSTTLTPVFSWGDLAEGSVVTGPAVLETKETTMVAPPGFEFTIGKTGEARLKAV